MKTSILVLILTSTVSALWAEDRPLIKAADGSGVYGYKDTPKLPWCEWLVHDPDRPVPPKLDPGKPIASSPPPADAVVLFDGSDLSQWTESDWEVSDGLLIATGDKSPISKQEFGSFQLHLEWRMPRDFKGPWYNMGNNGVLLHRLYEIQIFDSFHEPLYPDGQCAAVYAQTPPTVNVTLPPGEWQSFDIVFTAPVFENDKLVTPAYVTMFHNGVLVHHHQEIYGATGHMVLPHYNRKVSRGPIALAGHGCPVAFRNVWVRPTS
ncbi:MAG: hypothetical protein ACI9R3_004019 [Verrucomicrobiales bacterium]|jgi:hypothetical protein